MVFTQADTTEGSRLGESTQILVAPQVLAVPFLRKHNVKHDTVSEERDKYLKEKPSVEPSWEMANNICAKTKREWREMR